MRSVPQFFCTTESLSVLIALVKTDKPPLIANQSSEEEGIQIGIIDFKIIKLNNLLS